jgi:hypothetical protein
MNDLDPLIHHLHRQGSGSWAQFSRCVEAFDETLDPWSCARGMAEHAIVEFDFDNDRDWSVTSVQLVDIDRQGTVAWGGTPRALTSLDVDVEKGTRSTWIDRVEFRYEHGVRIGRRGGRWPRGLTPIGSATIVDAIPSLSNVVGARPASEAPLRKAERLAVSLLERPNPGGIRPYELRSEWVPSDGVSPNRDAAWKLDRSTYLISRNHRLFWVQKDVALWAGFLTEASRLGIEHLMYYDDSAAALQMAAYPRLPVAYVRALLLSGARESESRHRNKRLFRNVEPRTASWLGGKLGISLVR